MTERSWSQLLKRQVIVSDRLQPGRVLRVPSVLFRLKRRKIHAVQTAALETPAARSVSYVDFVIVVAGDLARRGVGEVKLSDDQVGLLTLCGCDQVVAAVP